MRVSSDSFGILDALAADVPRNSVGVSVQVPAGRPARSPVAAVGGSHTNDPHANDDTILIALTVDTCTLAAVRRTLHAALGDVLGIYTATIDRRTGRTCLQVEVAAGRARDALAAITRYLPDAVLGPVRSSHRSVHRARRG